MMKPLYDLTPAGDVKGGSEYGGDYGHNPGPKNGFFKSNLFIFLAGQVVTAAFALMFFAVGWGKLSQQFTESMEWRGVTQNRLERMDKEGTSASRYGLESERARMDNLDAKVKEIQEGIRNLPVMKSTLDRLEQANNQKR